MISQYNILIEKEYRKFSKEKPTIGLLMMLKNEQKRIHITLESMLEDSQPIVDAIIVYDTGSTDNTTNIIQDFCEKYKINLYMIQGEFVDFSTSRNVSLDYADTKDVYYLLLLDCNDELRGGQHLKKFAADSMKVNNNAFLVCQQWWCGKLDKYFNVRFVKARNGWRYRGSVHEWMKDTTVDSSEPKYPIVRLPENIFLYQDRTQDDDKSGKRFNRDYSLLLADHKKDPKEPRILFYLAQTCQCLGKNDETMYYSRLRTELPGFEEERFHSFMRCGNSAETLGHDWDDIISWYMKAFNHSNRVEPLVKIANYYKNKSKWHVAYMFAYRACQLSYPTHCILFVDKGDYDYTRWHILGIVAYYVGEYVIGKEACQKAIEAGQNKQLDTNNLKFYLEKEVEKPKEVEKETRQQFSQRVSVEIKSANPKLTVGQLARLIDAAWKKQVQKKNK